MRRKFSVFALLLCLILSLPLPAQACGEPFGSGYELAQHILTGHTLDLGESFGFSYTDRLDEAFAQPRALDSLLGNCGVKTYSYWHNDETRVVEVWQIEYYPGFRAACLAAQGKTELLSEQEKLILARAEEMVEEAQKSASSRYELLLAIHDLLVKQITYTASDDDIWCSSDTAEGALLYGEADCDGYADAFYLLASLAGFEVGIQHGQSLPDGGEYVWHKWNLVRWDGQWYHMDVTWDDLDWSGRPEVTVYPYFMVGSDLLGHWWVEELASCPAADTNPALYFYTADESGERYGAKSDSLEDAAAYAVRMQRDFGREQMHFMVKGSYLDDVWAVNEELGAAGLCGEWFTWVKEIGEYTCVSVTMTE